MEVATSQADAAPLQQAPLPSTSTDANESIHENLPMKSETTTAANDFVVPPTERAEIVDALYRFAAGQDLDDRALFESAFSSDAVLDFTQPAQRLGVEIAVFRGRQSIADSVFSAIHSLDTTHSVTNPRVVAFDGETALLSALVEAQHLPTADHRRHLMLKNIYMVRMSRHGRRWAIDEMKIKNIWIDGDPTVLFPSVAANSIGT